MNHPSHLTFIIFALPVIVISLMYAASWLAERTAIHWHRNRRR